MRILGQWGMVRLVGDEIQEGRKDRRETGRCLIKFLIIVCFEGGSQSLRTTTESLTDLWWFGTAGKGKGLAGRTAIVRRSFAPSSVAEVGGARWVV